MELAASYWLMTQTSSLEGKDSEGMSGDMLWGAESGGWRAKISTQRSSLRASTVFTESRQDLWAECKSGVGQVPLYLSFHARDRLYTTPRTDREDPTKKNGHHTVAAAAPSLNSPGEMVDHALRRIAPFYSPTPAVARSLD